MSKIVLTNNHFNLNGVKYFTGGADNVDLGSIGEKLTPITGVNRLVVKDSIPPGHITGVKSTVVEFDETKSSRNAFGTTVAAIVKGVPVQVGGDVAFSKLTQREFKLVKFSVPHEQMKRATNDSPRALQNLIRYGNDARIVHQFIYLMEGEESTYFDNDVSVSLAAGKGMMEATVDSRHTSSRTVTIKLAHVTLAYLLAKIDWDAHQDKNKTRIVDLDDDSWGL